MTPLTIWMIVTVLIGVFKNNEIKTDIKKYYKFAILICARNEQKVIINLLDSLSKQDYAGEYKVYLVADNCTDDTAKISHEHGAVVFERNDLSHIGKGYAMEYGVDCILKHSPDIEAICVFDADNLASSSFLTEMNKAFNSGAQVVSGYRDTKNIHESWLTEAYSVYWLMLMRFYYLPRRILKLSTLVGGTGFGFLTSSLTDKKWHTETLTEDIEFSIQQILKGNHIVYANKAVFYDEQPASFKDSVNQRLRWMCGGIQCLKLYFKNAWYAIIKGRKYLWDVLWYLLVIPASGLTVVFDILSIIVVCSTPVLSDYLILYVAFIIFSAVILVWIVAYATLKLEKRNIKTMRRAIFMYPIFMFTMMVFALISIFKQNLEWTPISHSNSLTIKQREKERQID